jgi:hypothetical protein
LAEIVECLNDGIERLRNLSLFETELLSAAIALERRMAAHPDKRHAALMPAILAANNLDVTVIERASRQAAGVGQNTAAQ